MTADRMATLLGIAALAALAVLWYVVRAMSTPERWDGPSITLQGAEPGGGWQA